MREKRERKNGTQNRSAAGLSRVLLSLSLSIFSVPLFPFQSSLSLSQSLWTVSLCSVSGLFTPLQLLVTFFYSTKTRLTDIQSFSLFPPFFLFCSLLKWKRDKQDWPAWDSKRKNSFIHPPLSQLHLNQLDLILKPRFYVLSLSNSIQSRLDSYLLSLSLSFPVVFAAAWIRRGVTQLILHPLDSWIESHTVIIRCKVQFLIHTQWSDGVDVPLSLSLSLPVCLFRSSLIFELGKKWIFVRGKKSKWMMMKHQYTVVSLPSTHFRCFLPVQKFTSFLSFFNLSLPLIGRISLCPFCDSFLWEQI